VSEPIPFKKCDGCGYPQPGVTMYCPDDTACAWLLCAPCRARAAGLCKRHRLSGSMADHQRVLRALREKGR